MIADIELILKHEKSLIILFIIMQKNKGVE
jgi:hypothetical protein